MELVLDTKYRLTAPVVHQGSNIIYTLCKQSGSVVAIQPDTGNASVAVEFNGQPVALAVDIAHNNNGTSSDVALLAADPSTQSVVTVTTVCEANTTATTTEAAEVRDLLRTFEGRPFIGPNALCVDCNGEVVFADGGMIGDSSLAIPRGALYRTVNNRQQLTRVTKGLAFPSAVAVSTDGTVIYVAEMNANRILRIVKLPEGGCYTSVFVQLSGGMGPVGLLVHPDTEELYIACYEQSLLANSGNIHVYYPNGELKGTITVPSPQITGIAFAADATALYITVDGGIGASSQLYRHTLSE